MDWCLEATFNQALIFGMGMQAGKQACMQAGQPQIKPINKAVQSRLAPTRRTGHGAHGAASAAPVPEASIIPISMLLHSHCASRQHASCRVICYGL